MARASRYFWPRGLRRLWSPIAAELKLFARTWLNVLLPHRLLRYRRLLAQPRKRLHVGCGSRRFEGWINLDMNPKGDFTLDLREGLPFRDASVECIYSEHALEHFDRDEDAPFLLGECLRVLRPGGRIRLTVPDGAAFIDYYVGRLDPERAEAIAKTHSRYHGTPMDVVNSAFRWKHQHRYIYDEPTLRALLEELGFAEVERRGFGDTEVDDFRGLDLPERRFETLYLEARRPPRA
jgi:predicted SAM-dependent methyltransferase